MGVLVGNLMSTRVRTFVAIVVVLAAAGVFSLAQVGDPNPARSAQAALCFACLAIFAEFLRYTLEGNIAATIVFIPFLAAIFLVPTWVSLVAIGTVAFVSTRLQKQTRVKSVFNIAQYVLTSTVAILVYRLLGGSAWLTRFDFRWAPYIAAYAAFAIVNNLLVTTVVTLAKGARPERTSLKFTTITDILILPLPYLFALVYLRFGPVGVMALGLPLLAARQLYRTNRQLEKVNQELLELMVAAIEARDPYTSGHSRRVARNARIIGRALGLASRDVDRVAIAALLHDVGKIHEAFAPLLRKPGKLSPEERATMETHPIKSAELVKNVSHLSDVVAAIRSHHENWDGTGYPDGLREEEIPVWSRIIMIADTVDAMTTDRPYRAAMGEAEVRAELLRMRGRQFDPAMCEKLLASTLYASLFEQQTARPTEMHGLRRNGVALRAAASA